MTTEAEITPVDRPLMLSDLNGVRHAMRDVSQKTLTMYGEFCGIRGHLRTYVAICAVSALVSLMAAAVSVAAVASAHP